MPDPVNPPTLIIVAEIGCWLAGLLLLVRLFTGRLGSHRPTLRPWTVSVEGFVMSILLVVAGGLLLPHAATYLNDDILGPAARNGDWWQIVQGAAFQLGMLGGGFISIIISRFAKTSQPPPLPEPAVTASAARAPAPRTPNFLIAGIATFAIALPVIGGIGFVWKIVVESLGFPMEEQEMVDLFRNAESPSFLVAMIVLASVIAPVTEEMIFRAGLFRYLRTRIPRWLALILPAVIFAVLHGNVVAFLPLFALGLFFALAYERTGNIAVPMIAHALFNLHTIVLVMAGVTA
ncbi:CPBP family intramembrane glutamic endopeptidase [Rariglobus hedericola]|uniref:CPBP family intramembrane metalloprotease n=1 Tax=Rariglobus hedericola TaxID=2597822 RepID=A0A556QQH8_9BACT|nr:CPBP family intramembrane glutamic endopeptidase [Rariglobus hedericola]TSJ78895.1 CPBP family intramembrane metalloprotease [Rariglobus hedericola]